MIANLSWNIAKTSSGIVSRQSPAMRRRRRTPSNMKKVSGLPMISPPMSVAEGQAEADQRPRAG